MGASIGAVDFVERTERPRTAMRQPMRHMTILMATT